MIWSDKKINIDAKYDGMEIYKLLSRFHDGRKKLKLFRPKKHLAPKYQLRTQKISSSCQAAY